MTLLRGTWPGLALALLLGGCSGPVAVALDEGAANRVVVALEQRGIVAEKQPDPQSEGRWIVLVARDESAAALSVLTAESLPPETSPGVLDSIGQGSLVPSRTAEHAKMVAGVAGDLERTLVGIDGVLTARVHLAVPMSDPLAPGDATVAPSASVLLRHRGASPPVAATEVARLVAGAIPGLTADRVAVVASSVAAAGAVDPGLARFGPITATRGTVKWVRLLGAGATLGWLLLSGLVVVQWARARRSEAGGGGADDAR